MEYFTPETLAIVYLLHESAQPPCEFDPNTTLANFIVTRIRINNKEDKESTFSEFLDELFHSTNDTEMVVKLKQQFEKFDKINEVFKFLSTTLKILRVIRNSRLEQGNLIDLYIRRTLLIFTKWEFNDLVKFQQNVLNYKMNKPLKPLQMKSFSNENKLEDLKNALENYPSVPIDYTLLNNSKSFHKIDFLKALALSKTKEKQLAKDHLHKFFDKSLNANENKQTPNLPNKINHAILNLANLNFKMGLYDEVLKGVSEALRISQNNGDDEGINQCLCYLYQISGLLGNSNEHVALIEYAISHALNLSNPTLMLYSCINYVNLERIYRLGDKEKGIFKSRNVSWTNTLHYATKKVFLSYDSALQIRNNDRDKNLTIPRTIEILGIILSLWKMNQIGVVNSMMAILKDSYKEILNSEKAMFYINELAYKISEYDYEESFKLFRDIANPNFAFKFYFYLLNIDIFLALSMPEAKTSLLFLQDLLKKIEDPLFVSILWSKQNDYLKHMNLFEKCYTSTLNLISFNNEKGFLKLNLKEELRLIQLQIENQLFELGLLNIEKLIIKTKDFEDYEKEIEANVWKALILAKMNETKEGIRVMREIELNTSFNLGNEKKGFYFYVKGLLNYQISEKKESIKDLNKALSYYIKRGELKKMKEICYFQSIIFHELGWITFRDKAAENYLNIDCFSERIANNRLLYGIYMEVEINILDIHQEILNIVENIIEINKI